MVHLSYRISSLVIATLMIVLGLASRHAAIAPSLPVFLQQYAGDTLWAMLVYFLFAIVFPQHGRIKLALYGLLFAYSIEISQLFHPPWLEVLRASRLGGLILGYQFVWSDMICYSVGIILAVSIDTLQRTLYSSTHKAMKR